MTKEHIIPPRSPPKLLPHLQPQITQVRPVHKGLNSLPLATHKASEMAFAQVFSASRMIHERSWLWNLPLISPFSSSSCSVSSRSSLAHLYSAGFPDIVDCSGQVAEVLDPTEPVPFDPQREETDLLQGNLLVFQFLAFSRWGLPYWVTRGWNYWRIAAAHVHA